MLAWRELVHDPKAIGAAKGFHLVLCHAEEATADTRRE